MALSKLSKAIYSQVPYFPGPSLLAPLDLFEDYSVLLRKGLYQVLLEGKTDEVFLFNEFTILESWLPYKSLEDLKKDDPNGRLYLVAYPFDSANQSRTNMVIQEVPILVGFQIASVLPDDIARIDSLRSFVSQVEFVCRHYDPDHYSYTRTEALKDDEGLPFAYENITKGIFETYFIVYYNLVAR